MVCLLPILAFKVTANSPLFTTAVMPANINFTATKAATTTIRSAIAADAFAVTGATTTTTTTTTLLPHQCIRFEHVQAQLRNL